MQTRRHIVRRVSDVGHVREHQHLSCYLNRSTLPITNRLMEGGPISNSSVHRTLTPGRMVKTEVCEGAFKRAAGEFNVRAAKKH